MNVLVHFWFGHEWYHTITIPIVDNGFFIYGFQSIVQGLIPLYVVDHLFLMEQQTN